MTQRLVGYLCCALIGVIFSSCTQEDKRDIGPRAAEVKQKTAEAEARLDRAALLAKVKGQLISDVGLSTVSKINVDVSGSVVTLTGKVSSEDQKRQAERVTSQVHGVTRVINNLSVE